MIVLLIGPNCLNEVSFKTNQPITVKNKEGEMGFTSLIPLLGPGLLYQYFAESKSIKVIEPFPLFFCVVERSGVNYGRKSWNDLTMLLLWALDSIRHSSGDDIKLILP